MYNILSAIAKPMDGGGRWAALAVGDMSLSYLFANYSKILVTLGNAYLPGPVTLDMEDIRPQYGGLSITFNELLINLGEDSLPTTDGTTEINTRYAKFSDLHHAGYAMTPIHSSASVDAQHNMKDKHWLRLTRPNTDYSLFYKSCLVMINGYYHATDYDSNGVYVINAMVTSRKSGENHIGALSFREIGELSFIPITKEHIVAQAPGVPLKDACYITLPVDVSDKIVMLVLGGYLHMPGDDTFFLSSDKIVSVKFNNYPMIERYFESRDNLDLSSLPLETTDRNATQISVENIFSDEVLKAYLTLSQSFFVILNKSDLFVEKLPLLASHMPGMYTSFHKPIYPMVNMTGRGVAYWYKAEVGQYAVNCVDSTAPFRMQDKADVYAQHSVDASQYTNGAELNSPAYFMRIGSDI